MRHLLTVLTVAFLLAGMSTAVAGPIADSIAYQGLLLDASDNPVPDGPRDLILSIWTDPTGGTMLHSEVRVVNVKNGLFSTCIGCGIESFFDVFAEQSVYLEIQLAGQSPMSPRSPIRNVPQSLVSSRVRGDISTSPDQLSVGDLDGDGFLSVSSAADESELALARKRPGKVKYCNIVIKTMQDSLSDIRDCDSDDDGLPDSEYSQRLTPTTSSMAIKTKGTGAAHNRVASATFTDSAVQVLEADLDGDGVPESEISQHLTPTTSSMAIKTKGTGADKNRTISSTCDDSSAVSYLDLDDDGDGISEAEAVSTVSSLPAGGGAASAAYAATGRWSTDSDDDGVPEGDITQSVTPTTCSVAIKTKGTGADKNRSSVIGTTGLDSAAIVCDYDSDGDGVPESEISQHLTPTTSSMAIKTKGTGASNARSISSSCDDVSAVHLLTVDEDGDGLADRLTASSVDSDSAQMLAEGSGIQVSMKVKNKGVVKGAINIVNANRAVVDFDSDGDGYLDNSLGVGVDATHRIDVVGGAYCDGTDWVNASDVNSKENFQQVDGEELLEQISALEITKWNYKGDRETEHIGPTAQDFQEAFGVGSDGKSISTIDPSGIALAAIKALSQKNAELAAQVGDLKRLIEEIARRK